MRRIARSHSKRKIKYSRWRYKGIANKPILIAGVLIVALIGGVFLSRTHVNSGNSVEKPLGQKQINVNGNTPFIQTIEPSTGAIGDKITIRGTGFTASGNDIAFTHQDLTSYESRLSSSDGKIIHLTVPEMTGACPRSIARGCLDIGYSLPKKTLQLSVINKNGESNKVAFTVTLSQRES